MYDKSDEELAKAEETIGTFPVEVIERFLSSVEARRPCEACGHSSWAHIPSYPLFQMHCTNAQSLVLQVLPIFCQQCGNTRLFNASRIDYFVRMEIQGDKDAAKNA
ncbi:hypothetical protein [Pseudomonas sp. USHLN015]|uniref:hypothetical protein n=1 Tax=Pseudomonas sp. USHLN015 TaxID=3081296 RepID=UPI00301B8B91